MLEMIFSNQFVAAVIRMTTPLIFTAMAACVGRQANVVCFAFEGMMLFAALGGAVASAYTHSLLLGIFFGLLSGMFIALFFGYFVIYLDTKPMLMSIALNTLGSAGTIFICYMLTGSKAGTSSLQSLTFPALRIPALENVPFLGGLFGNSNILSYAAFICVPVVFFLIYKTPLGLKIRAVGRNPGAAQAVGIDVKRTKLIAILIEGALASFGGMFMSMAYLPYFTMDMVAGRGFMAIAANNLGLGNPVATMLCTMGFGVTMAIGNVWQSFNMPAEFAAMIPYVATLIGLCFGVAGSEKRGRKRKPFARPVREESK